MDEICKISWLHADSYQQIYMQLFMLMFNRYNNSNNNKIIIIKGY